MQRIALVIIACCLSQWVNANTTSKNPPAPQDRFALDQSQDIFFDLFTTSSYSLQVLQSKPLFAHRDLIIGGSLQTDLQKWFGNQIAITSPGIYKQGSGLYLTQITLDVMANVNEYITGFISFAYSGVGISESSGGNYYYFPEAFLLFGNLKTFPSYLTLGIAGIPFGAFTLNGPWDLPLTASYFYPAQAPQLSAGYYNTTWNVAVTAFNDVTNYEYHSVMNIKYNKKINDFSYTIGAGYLSHLKTNEAGSPRSQKNRRTTAPAIDMGGIKNVNGKFQYLQTGISLEYAEGSNQLAFHSAKPKAYAIGATYAPQIAGAETTFALTYSRAINLSNIPTTLPGKDALPLALDGLQNEWSLGVSRQIMIKNIVLGLEAQKSTTFAESDTYTGTVDLILYL